MNIMITFSWNVLYRSLDDILQAIRGTKAHHMELNGITHSTHPQISVECRTDIFYDVVANGLGFVTLLNNPQPLEQFNYVVQGLWVIHMKCLEHGCQFQQFEDTRVNINDPFLELLEMLHLGQVVHQEQILGLDSPLRLCHIHQDQLLKAEAGQEEMPKVLCQSPFCF